MLKYKLKEEVFFNDGNFVSKDEFLQKVDEHLEDGMFKVETTGDFGVKKIFWVKKNNLITVK
tara:strand:+ start:134 stop:319 length:186 start_codon:yes stop_codon:yes gene_type:complete